MDLEPVLTQLLSKKKLSCPDVETFRNLVPHDQDHRGSWHSSARAATLADHRDRRLCADGVRVLHHEPYLLLLTRIASKNCAFMVHSPANVFCQGLQETVVGLLRAGAGAAALLRLRQRLFRQPDLGAHLVRPERAASAAGASDRVLPQASGHDRGTPGEFFVSVRDDQCAVSGSFSSLCSDAHDQPALLGRVRRRPVRAGGRDRLPGQHVLSVVPTVEGPPFGRGAQKPVEEPRSGRARLLRLQLLEAAAGQVAGQAVRSLDHPAAQSLFAAAARVRAEEALQRSTRRITRSAAGTTHRSTKTSCTSSSAVYSSPIWISASRASSTAWARRPTSSPP